MDIPHTKHGLPDWNFSKILVSRMAETYRGYFRMGLMYLLAGVIRNWLVKIGYRDSDRPSKLIDSHQKSVLKKGSKDEDGQTPIEWAVIWFGLLKQNQNVNLLNLEGLDQSMAYLTERTKRKPDPIREILCILGSMFTLTQVSTISRASLEVNTEEDWPGGRRQSRTLLS